jgi:hypothetical protein
MEFRMAGLPRNPVRTVDLTQLLSASIAVYRSQAELFDGRCDGKCGVLCEEG